MILFRDYEKKPLLATSILIVWIMYVVDKSLPTLLSSFQLLTV